MEFRGLTQEELAARLGVSQATVSRYISDPQRMSLGSLIATAEAIGTSPASLHCSPDVDEIYGLLSGADPDIVNIAIRSVKGIVGSSD